MQGDIVISMVHVLKITPLKYNTTFTQNVNKVYCEVAQIGSS